MSTKIKRAKRKLYARQREIRRHLRRRIADGDPEERRT